MTVVLGIALLIQATMLAALRFVLGKAWLHRPAVICCVVSVLCQGVSEVILGPSGDQAREGIAPEWLADAALVTTVVMAAFAAGYLLAAPRTHALAAEPPRMPAFGLLIAGTVASAVWTFEGRGFSGGFTQGANTSVATSFASTLFTVLAVATAYETVRRAGPRWFLPVLAGQSLMLAAAGERTPVIACAIALGLMITASGHRPPRAQVHVAVAMTAVAVLAITGARLSEGRDLFYGDTGAGARVTALSSGVTAGAQQPLLAEGAERTDADAYTAGILQAEHLGTSPLSVSGVADSLAEVVPSALWPSKLASTSLDPATASIAHFGLQDTNFLPGLAGLYAGFLSWRSLTILMGTLGLAAGWGERWLVCKATAARLVMLAGAVIASIDYLEGLPGMLLALRGAAILAVAVWVLEGARVRYKAVQPVPVPAAGTGLRDGAR
jgi:hypothetical protein